MRDGAATSYTYDINSNRLSAVDKITSDTDLDGVFDDTDFAKATAQSLSIEGTSNRVLGSAQTVTTTNKGRTRSVVVTPVSYMLDANGAMTGDGLRMLEYDASNRLSKVRVLNAGEAASIAYLHNALGQRVFKGEPVADQTLPNETELGTDFVTWLKKQFGWLFVQAAANTSVGTAYIYDEDANLLGEYDNGSAKGKGRSEYIWLPTDSGQAIPVGIYRNGKFFAVHSDHLGTPRLVTNEANAPVWQWPYSAFGSNKPTGILKATPKPKQALTNQPVLLKATAAAEVNLRFPGQYFDEESGLSYNYFRSYNASQGRYTQFDPIGFAGGWNGFGYVGGNPLSFTDFLGLSSSGGAMPSAGAGGGNSCDPETCGKLKADIFRKFNLLLSELRKYDPVADAKGGFSMRFGSGTTKPGGHYQEIRDLQQGLKNDIQRYNRECKDRDDGGGGTFSAIARSIDEAANRPVAEPPISRSMLPSAGQPLVCDPRSDRLVPGSSGNGSPGGLAAPLWRFMLP